MEYFECQFMLTERMTTVITLLGGCTDTINTKSTKLYLTGD
jgi:hypothetical protein